VQILSQSVRKIGVLLLHAILLLALPVKADNWFSNLFADEILQVTVNDAFLNVYSGPGRGYPIFHIVEREEVITLIKSRTEWIKIKTRRNQVGWIRREDMLLTLSPNGEVPEFPKYTRADYLEDRIEMGAAYGDFDGADSMTVNLGYRFTRNLSAEIRVAENTGIFADSNYFTGALLFQPFSQWRLSPYLGIGAGTLKTSPSATLIDTEDREDTIMQASAGTYLHITGRLFLRAEYTNHYILTSRNTNEEVNEWKVGLNVFF
jgi:Bacterial SH3 domain/Outer membrane protein beta-barrel domain